MKIHPVLQSYSEVKTYNILQNILSKYGYEILASVRLCDVLKPDKGERLDEYENSLYRYGHFDFLVCRKEKDIPLMPIFAVEFDGPQHENDPIQIRRDEYKNRFCKDANFNLLRITIEQLEEYEKVSLLSYMLERYISWQKEYPRIMTKINERFNETDPNDPMITEMRESWILDPYFDPSFIFDIKHPYPAVLTITHRLLLNKIFTLRSSRQMNEYLRKERPSVFYLCEVVPSSGGCSAHSERWSHSSTGYLTKRKRDIHVPHKITYTAEGVISEPPGLIEVIHIVEKTATLKWGCSVGRSLGNIPPFGEIKDIVFCDLSGVHIPDIAEQFAEYLCLREIEKWIESNLRV